ncbi:MAG: hypothetical protein COB40_04625 [Marinosulfonomonas sp.]|nr:MAG: hypothetical protein COB40_04625 [Marinosulfonomonas sp.]
MNKMQTKPHHETKDKLNDLLEGWDTVFAIRYADVNSAIVKAGSSPAAFSETETDQGDTASIDGTFSDWAIAVGGAGHSVLMSLPVPTVLLQRTGHPDETRTNVTYTIRVEMAAVPQGDPGPDGGTLHEIRLKLPTADGNAVVTVEDCVYTGSESDQFVKIWLIGLMGNWLNKNLQEFNHTFATVNLNAKAAVGKFQWLMPTHTSYAVTDDMVTMESGIFGVLCMIGNRPPSPDQIISSQTIPPGKRSSFLISKERFLSKLMIPGMGHMFSGPIKPVAGYTWPEDYFELTENKTAITNKEGLRIDQMQVGDEACDCEIDAQSMIVKMEETYLDVLFQDLRHPYIKKLGNYWLNIHHNFQTRNVVRLNDNQVFDLVPGSGTTELEVSHHTAFAKKTKFAETIDWVLIFVNIATLIFPLARWGWLKFAAQDVSKTAEGAVQIMNVVEEGPLIESEAENMAAEGAQGATEMAQTGKTSIGKWLLGSLVSKRAFAIFVMSSILTAEQILAAIADKDAEKELPQYKEFAARVMEPVTWPEAAAEYTVEEIQFNGSFQTIGNPNFSF